MVCAGLQRDRERAAEAIKKYVAENGYVEKTNGEINEILSENGAVPEDAMYQNSDLFYNWTNKANFNDFKNDTHLFERLGRNHYRLLGPGYPYTGEILREDRKTKEILVVGEWYNGDLIAWNPKEILVYDTLNASLREESARIEEELSGISGEDKEVLAKMRINQGVFRKRLLRRYSHCCLCGVENKGLLTASHIKPWSIAAPEERTDVNNGLLLCPNHDRAFDRGFISFGEDGNILVSGGLSSKDRLYLNINEQMCITVTLKNQGYIAYHRNHIFNL